MSAFSVLLPGSGDSHPYVLNRRIRELLLLAASAVIPLALALAISLEVSKPNLLLVFGLIVGGIGILTLVGSDRYPMTLTLIVLYLGLLEGPVKLGSGAHEEASVIRDILIFAVCLGAVLRLLVKRESITLPSLSAWPLAYAVLVLIEALNPNTHGILKVLGGYRQQLEWVPFFFFGYVVMRSRERFRKLFLVLGVLALANGAVSTYQTRLSPGQLASWGPGYRELVFGASGISARTYASGGVSRVRPPALGTDAGFGGAVGVVALPGLLALLATGTLRRRWPVLLLCLGALAGVATGLGRLQVVGAVVALFAFTALSFSSAGRHITRPLAAMLALLVLALPLGAIFVSYEGSSTFSRYTELAPSNVTEAKDTKVNEVEHIPHQIVQAPFGVGLGTVGASAGFGGLQKELLEGHNTGGESQYKFVVDELGLPGLLLWVGLLLTTLWLALPRLRRVVNFELRMELAAIVSPVIAMAVMGFSGPVMSSAALGPFFWFAAGVVAYWFSGPGRRVAMGETATVGMTAAYALA
jgi:hypothetical protein